MLIESCLQLTSPIWLDACLYLGRTGNGNTQIRRIGHHMNKLIKYLALAAAVVGLAATVRAVPISGSVGFGGVYTQVGGTQGNLTTATSLTIATPVVISALGDFVGAASPTFASPIVVNVNPPLIGQLWSVTVGAAVYTFTVTSQNQDATTPVNIHLVGTGIISDGAGPKDDTAGVWQLGFGVSGESFTFQTTSAANNVPDGGMTVLLLGAALSGLALIRRKLA